MNLTKEDPLHEDRAARRAGFAGAFSRRGWLRITISRDPTRLQRLSRVRATARLFVAVSPPATAGGLPVSVVAKPRWTLAGFSLIALFVCGAEALVIKDYAPEVNDRFQSGYPTAPVPNINPKFIGVGLDWSGVGWETNDPTHNYCLISPRHFVYASHQAPQVGESVSFVSRDGRLKTYRVAKLQQVGADGKTLKVDTGVATLAQPIPVTDYVAHYKIFSLGPKGRGYVGQKILMYGHTARIGTNEIVDALLIHGVSSEFNYLTVGLTHGMAKTESGDSGGPSLVAQNAELAILGTHWKIDTDVLLAGVVDGINQILRQDGYVAEVLDQSKP